MPPHDEASVAVTGLGAVSPLGCGVASFVRALREARSGVRPLPQNFEGLGRMKSRAAARCDDFSPDRVLSDADQRRLPRCVPMALQAAREALAHAGLNPLHDPELSRRIGLILGTGAGGIDFTLDQARIVYEPGAPRQPSLWTITNATHGNLAGELSIRLGLHGPSWCISTGCASSSDAVGNAMEHLRGHRPGSPDVFVVVGADAHVRWETLMGMELLRVISTRDPARPNHPRDADPSTFSRPFDRSRDGFILGEGAWALVLEREPHRAARAGVRLARALGYGSTCDAFHRVRPDPDMVESARAMSLALEDAGASPEHVDVLHYHGTSTQANDALESAAVRRVFQHHAPRLIGHSVKGAIGHPQGACGAAAIVASIGAMRALDQSDRQHPEPFLPSTVNLLEPDIEGGCDLNYTPGACPPRGHSRTLMVNCLAFGAKNSALVFDVDPINA